MDGPALKFFFDSKRFLMRTVPVTFEIMLRLAAPGLCFLQKSLIRGASDAAKQNLAVCASIMIGVINFLATLLGMYLIDRSGRKPLLMWAFTGMGLCLSGGGSDSHWDFAYLGAPLVLGYLACFAVGVGTRTWAVMSEICLTRVRGRAMSAAIVVLWCGTLTVTLTFLSLLCTY